MKRETLVKQQKSASLHAVVQIPVPPVQDLPANDPADRSRNRHNIRDNRSLNSILIDVD